MRKYVTTNKIWKITACYLAIIALLDFFHVRFDYNLGEITFRPFVSILFIIEIIIIGLLAFKTKLGYLLTIIHLFLLAFMKLPLIVTMNYYLEMWEIYEQNTLSLKINFLFVFISIGIHLLLIVCLLAKKSSRNELKQANWIVPSFLGSKEPPKDPIG